MPQPLILTLVLDNNSQRYFNDLRKAHFPVERNFLDAHLTLFHQLPANEPSIIKAITSAVSSHNQFQMQVTGLVSIGNGAAFKIESDELAILHKSLQNQWHQWTILQDKQKLWPHITIQNKVTPEAAKQLIQELAVNFKPFEITAIGLSLWEYLGGPWRFMETYTFDTGQK